MPDGVEGTLDVEEGGHCGVEGTLDVEEGGHCGVEGTLDVEEGGHCGVAHRQRSLDMFRQTDHVLHTASTPSETCLTEREYVVFLQKVLESVFDQSRTPCQGL